MKTKVTLTRADACAPASEPDWEAFAATDGSAVRYLCDRDMLYERIDGGWMCRTSERPWSKAWQGDEEIAEALRDGYSIPVHLEIRWRPAR